MPTKKIVGDCDSPEADCPSTTRVAQGKRLRITKSNNCESDLAPDCKCLPGLPIQLTESKVEIRNGSKEFPIELPCLQSFTGQQVPEIIFRQTDGTLTVWKAPQLCGKYKLSINNGMFVIEEDTIPHLIPSDVCQGTCDDIDYLLGVKQTTIACPGFSPKTMLQLFKVPKCCCTADQISGVSI